MAQGLALRAPPLPYLAIALHLGGMMGKQNPAGFKKCPSPPMTTELG